MVDIKNLTITYPLKQADGSQLIVKIENTPDFDETLGLYAHTEPLSTLVVAEVQLRKKETRKIKKS